MRIHLLSTVIPSVLAFGAAYGQTADGPLSFEVASLKRASTAEAKDAYAAGYNAGVRAALASQGLRVSGQTVRVTDNTLKDLIRLAYQLKDYQITGPAWIAEDKFEIAATIPAGTDRSQVPDMLRTLLEQRFHLRARYATRDMAVYALVDGKGGGHLTPSSVTRGGPGMVNANTGQVRAIACSLAGFADLLTKAAGRPVIDATGITGLYDFDLSYTPDLSAPETDERPMLDAALRQQAGLRLEKRQMPVKVLIVDKADRAFTEN